MITDLAQRVCQKVNELDQRNRGASINQNIQRTGIYLEKFRNRYKPVAESVQLCQYRLKASDRTTLVEKLRFAKSILLQSRKVFLTETNQIAALNEADEVIQKDLLPQLAKVWFDSINNEVKPISETIKMTYTFLPEADQSIIVTAQNEIKERMRVLPKKAEDVAMLEAYIGRLRAYTQEDNGDLSPEVKLFLNKVQSGEATLNDLNDEVLRWIRDSGNAIKFYVSLSQGQA